MFLSLHTIPVELVYRILDHLYTEELFRSAIICQRLNTIVNSYHRYQVKRVTFTHDIEIETFFIDNYRSWFWFTWNRHRTCSTHLSSVTEQYGNIWFLYLVKSNSTCTISFLRHFKNLTLEITGFKTKVLNISAKHWSIIQ